MNLRSRVRMLERRQAAQGPGCPGCGWDGRIVTVVRHVDAEGRTLQLADDGGKPLLALPNRPACGRCRHEIGLIVINMAPPRRARGRAES